MPYTDQQKAMYVDMRASGLSKEDALHRIQFEQWKASHRYVRQGGVEAPEGEVLPSAGAGEAFGRGLAQGATLRFGDEAQGLIQAVGNRITGYHDDSPNPPTLAEDYSRERDLARAENERARKAHPGAYISGEIGGGVATSPVMGGASTFGGATFLSAKIGAAGGLGGSNAELTRGGELGQVAKDVAIGAAVGAAAGAAGYGIAKGVGANGRWILDKIGARSRLQDAANDSAVAMAATMGKESAIGPSGTTARTNLEKSRELVAEWKGMGQDLQLTPAQASGSRAQALRELRLRQNPATMDDAQALETMQLENAAKIADSYVGRIARNPELLGDHRVAESAANAVSLHAEKLLATRSAVAKPLYEAAEAAGGGVDYAPIRAAFQKEIQDYNLKPNEITGLMGSLYGKLEKTSAGGGLSLTELNAARSKLLSVIRGKESLLGNAVPKTTEVGIAGRLLGTIDDSFTAAESTSSGSAAQMWRQANEAWRKGTEAYESAMTDTVKSLLTKAAGDSAESIPARLLSAEPSQVRGVFTVLAKESPADAANLRAQMLEELMVRGGKPSSQAPLAAAKGVSKANPGRILNLLESHEPQLQAAFAGDNKALLSLDRMYDLFQRVGFGPNIKGSTTQPQIADAFAELGGGVLDRMASGNGYTAAALQLVRRHLEAITGNNRLLAQTISTREGIEATNKALGLILDGKTGKPITETAIRSVASAITNLGLSQEEAPTEENPQPQTQPPALVAAQGRQQ